MPSLALVQVTGLMSQKTWDFRALRESQEHIGFAGVRSHEFLWAGGGWLDEAKSLGTGKAGNLFFFFCHCNSPYSEKVTLDST